MTKHSLTQILVKTDSYIDAICPGTDLIAQDTAQTPNYDNMFAGSNWDAEDYDDWNIIQREFKNRWWIKTC